MTHGIPSLKMLAAQAAANQPVTVNVPEELVTYLANVVDLTTVTTEPPPLAETLAALWNEIQTTEDDEFDAERREDIRARAESLGARADKALALMASAREAVTQETNGQWREYFTKQCDEAVQVLTTVRNDAAQIEADMRNYPDDDAYEL